MAPLFANRFSRTLSLILLAAVFCGLGSTGGRSEALLLVEAESGKILHAENAGYPWYPASITKLMTAYVTLKAVKEGRVRLDTLLTVSDNAVAQQPSKMGFPAGTQVTIDNALKMLMVKSANDMAVVLAEGVSGSVEAFADEMNRASVRLGMVQSSWVNPNGLPAEGQVTSARDMAILARALFRELPEHDLYWHISAIKFGRRTIRNYNRLIDRYPGADGMKTGFICASGYNLVASATRDGRRLIAVVLGAPSGTTRAEVAAALLEKGFQGSKGLSWLTPSLGSVESVQPIAASPPNLRDEICGRHRGRARTDHAEEEEQQHATGDSSAPATAYTSITPEFRMNMAERQSLLGSWTPSMEPIRVSVIPKKGAPDPEKVAEKPAKRVGKKKGKPAASAVATAEPPAEQAAEDKPKKDKRRLAAKPAKPAMDAKPAPKVSREAKPTEAKTAVAPVKPAKPRPAKRKPAAADPAGE
ncbi:MAG: D-alanyl-D-alanine carboxypeptidase [Variibacter sp.]|nr:D-alanyl-D-alanine carboxypeptidase [Variibacter sp.]